MFLTANPSLILVPPTKGIFSSNVKSIIVKPISGIGSFGGTIGSLGFSFSAIRLSSKPPSPPSSSMPKVSPFAKVISRSISNSSCFNLARSSSPVGKPNSSIKRLKS